MDEEKMNILNSLKEELGRLIVLSFGVFLFILFFQPFPLGMLDYNNRLLFVTGFGAITFLAACIILILIPLTIPKWVVIRGWDEGTPFILSVLFVVITATAYAFYIRYVGETPLTLYIMFKVILVTLISSIILLVFDKYRSLKNTISALQETKQYYLSRIGEFEKTEEKEEIEIVSDSKNDKLRLMYQNIIYVKSADNYIEIYYKENGVVENKLIRNTLKNIESQLAHHRGFIRCHRTSILNIRYIEKLVRNYSGHSIKLKFCDNTIPVSRQYLMLVKEAISTNA